MKLLSIDTSSKTLSLAISKGEVILAYKNTAIKKNLADVLMPNILSLLKKAGMTLKKLDGFVVGLGPGSFTGLRVGVATIKGLAFATEKPVVGISSLDVIAQDVKPSVSQVCVMVDARRNLVYSAIFTRKNGVLKKSGKYLLANLEETIKRVKSPTVFVGDGATLYEEGILKALTSNAVCVDKKIVYPDARRLSLLGLERFLLKNTDDVSKLEPLYLYPEDCQVRR